MSGCWDLALAFLVIVAFFAVMECADVFGYNPNSKHVSNSHDNIFEPIHIKLMKVIFIQLLSA